MRCSNKGQPEQQATILCECVCVRCWMWWVLSPVSRARVHMQEKVDTSRFILRRPAENSKMPSIHSPKPRRHWRRGHTEPSQKISLASSGLDLRQEDNMRYQHRRTRSLRSNPQFLLGPSQ